MYLDLDLESCTRTWTWSHVPGPGVMYPDLESWTWPHGLGLMDMASFDMASLTVRLGLIDRQASPH